VRCACPYVSHGCTPFSPHEPYSLSLFEVNAEIPPLRSPIEQRKIELYSASASPSLHAPFPIHCCLPLGYLFAPLLFPTPCPQLFFQSAVLRIQPFKYEVLVNRGRPSSDRPAARRFVNLSVDPIPFPLQMIRPAFQAPFTVSNKTKD